MKKTLLLLVASVVLTFSAACVSAEDYMPTSGQYNVIYNVGKENAAGMYGMVAIKGTDAIIDTANLENIYYINQTSATADGDIKFLDFALKGVAPDHEDFVECTVFIGGPGYDTSEAIGVLKKSSGDIPVEPEDKTFVISGEVISTVGFTPATVTVNNASGETVATTQTATDGTFSVSVPEGEDYSITINKKSHCSYTITGVDVAANIVLDVIDFLTLAGDVNSTGDINFYDLKIVLDDYNKKTTDADLIDINADIDESGDINFYDLMIVLDNFYNKTISKTYSAQ